MAAAAREGRQRDLAATEEQIDEFVERCPESENRDKVLSFRHDLDLYKLERKYELRMKLRGGTKSLGTVQRSYLAAIRDAKTDPFNASLELEALLAIYSGADNEKEAEQCLELAREQLPRFRASAQVMIDSDLKLIQERLDAADTMSESDPDVADEIRRGVIRLYSQTSWAQEAVDRARKSFQER